MRRAARDFDGWQVLLDRGYRQPRVAIAAAELVSWAVWQHIITRQRLIVDPGQGVVTNMAGAVLAHLVISVAPGDVTAELRYQARALGVDYDRVDRPDHEPLFVLGGRL